MSEALLIQTVASTTSGEIFAAIGVTYPTGSICKCTNADASVELEATGTDGAFIFNIPSLGDWTVSCTDGEMTADETVSINAQWENKSVYLSYGTFIFKNGEQYSDITGGWKLNSTSSIQDNCIYLYSRSERDDTGSAGQVCTYNSINITPYNQVHFLVDNVEGTVVLAESMCGIGASSTSYAKMSKFNQAGVISVDISSYTGPYYVMAQICTKLIAGYSCSASISKIWFT